MIKVAIFSVGKNKEEWLEGAIREYEKRLTGKISFSYEWLKDDRSLAQSVAKEKVAIALDPRGKLYTSEEFAEFFQLQVEKGGAKLSFVIGGPEGLPAEIRESRPLLSLSPMTFTHQTTRALLVEQIYRAFTILEGAPYHK